MKKRLSLILLIGLLSLSLGAARPLPLPADLSGAWEFTFDLTTHITKSAAKGPLSITKKASKTVRFVIEQQGEKLTVTCCEPEEKMTGIVENDQVTFEREYAGEGKTQKAVYKGTLESPTKMTGVRKLLGDANQSEHKWSAIKKDQ
jgi:hypothetical protein